MTDLSSFPPGNLPTRNSPKPMETTTQTALSQANQPFIVGDWTVHAARGALRRGRETRALEPKVMDLLVHMAGHPGQVLSREALGDALWHGTVVGEDVLSRTVSKLRKALGDSATAPAYIETVPKRGYRLIAPVKRFAISGSASDASERIDVPSTRVRWRASASLTFLICMAAWAVWAVIPRPGDDPETATRTDSAEALGESGRLTQRADALYMAFTRADNEAAIALYNRAITADPDNAPARAGLANALVQRVVRWSTPPGAPPAAASLTQALRQGSMEGPDQRATLERATRLAEQAVRLAPRDADALKALGFAYAASGRADAAIAVYEDAVALDPDAWISWVNLGEMENMRSPGSGLDSFIQAYEAMERHYATDPQFIGPLQPSVGLLVGDMLYLDGQGVEAERWYRRVLDQSPFEPDATARLARALLDSGDPGGARQLCETLQTRIGSTPGCGALVDSMNEKEAPQGR
ncbi:MAG: tetratricopeptide repeat protein [Pseudomonadota bacterium]